MPGFGILNRDVDDDMLNSLWPMLQFIQLPRRQWEAIWSSDRSKQPIHVLQPTSDQFLQQVRPTDAVDEDDENQTKDSYEALKTVKPVFDAQLNETIQALIERYEQNHGQSIPAAWRWCKDDVQGTRWKTNKPDRLLAVLWIVNHLPTVETAADSINQVACALEKVESLAHQRALVQDTNKGRLVDAKPMRLTQPLPEICDGQPVLVAYGIRHVTLFNVSGAIQVQCLPESMTGAVNYRRQAQYAERVLLNKPGTNGWNLWLDE